MRYNRKKGWFYALGIGFSALVIFYILILPDDEPYRHLGKLHIEDTDGLYVNIYQENDFDHNTSLSYEIVNDSGGIVVGQYFLYGTTTHNEKITSFSAGICDSIIYITWYPSNRVYALHDLRTHTGYPHRIPNESTSETFRRKDILFEKVKACRDDLEVVK